MRLIALTAAFALSLAGAAWAGQPVTLRTDITTSGPVTLGDLFDGAGAGGKVVVAPAIKDGVRVMDVAEVQRAALRAGLDWSNPGGIQRIIVHSVAAPPAAQGAGQAAGQTAGQAQPAGATVSVLAYSRSLDTGEILQADDLTWAKVVQAPVGAPRDADELIGKQAKRPLREGASALIRDVSSPLVIKKDDMVTVTFAEDGVSLSMAGKAAGSAAVGDTISIINPSTKKSIQAVAAGPGRAVIGAEADRLRGQALTDPSQFAAR